jgi:type IV fimbrial biogenesis protein FimT
MLNRNSSRGITLVELCFALAIVGVLASLSIPSLRSARAAGAVHGATFELAAGLQQARASAIVEARPTALCLADATGRCLRGNGPAMAWRVFRDETGEPTITLRPLPAGVLLYATRPKVTFWPLANAASTTTLTICASHGDARPRAIVISQSGRTRHADSSPERCHA